MAGLIGNQPEATKDLCDAVKVDSVTDILIAFSSLPVFVFWRREDFGSWFIQAIAEVFSKNAYGITFVISYHR